MGIQQWTGYIVLFVIMFLWVFGILDFQKWTYRLKPAGKVYRNYEDIPKKTYEREIVFSRKLPKKWFLFRQKLRKKMRMSFWAEKEENTNLYQLRKVL